MSKGRWEADAKERFLAFLLERRRHEYAATGEDVITNPLTHKNFDYELTPSDNSLPVIALEIFRLVGDEQDLAHHSAWNDVVLRLGTELRERGITGYLIRTPHFNVPKSKRGVFASETADWLAAEIASRPEQDEFSVDDYVFYKDSRYTQVQFSYIGGARQIDPFGSVTCPPKSSPAEM
jgi:hypothetical protein